MTQCSNGRHSYTHSLGYRESNFSELNPHCRDRLWLEKRRVHEEDQLVVIQLAGDLLQ